MIRQRQVQGMLGRAMSSNVYKNNSCGPAKNYALQALERELVRRGIQTKYMLK